MSGTAQTATNLGHTCYSSTLVFSSYASKVLLILDIYGMLVFSFYDFKVLLVLGITRINSGQIIGLQIPLRNPTIVAENSIIRTTYGDLCICVVN